MISDEMRKKWGTIFMGGRESTMEQLDAMQEPLMRDRLQKERQDDYLERVRQRATERAREILTEAYAEKQRLLDEAKAEIEAQKARFEQEIQSTATQSAAMRDEAEKALAHARQLDEEAEAVRRSAHDEGFQAGMTQAGEELKEFRAEMGLELASLLRAIDGQIEHISAFWREELVELVRTAVSSATGWLMEAEHETIVRSLVLEAIGLLEERTTLIARVNPADEAVVSDMFKAAREKAPELRQWIVEGDESIERGGLSMDSGTGSADLRRQFFRELVDGVLEHLTLPAHEEGMEIVQAAHAGAEAAALRFAQEHCVPPEEPVVRETESVASPQPMPDESGSARFSKAPDLGTDDDAVLDRADGMPHTPSAKSQLAQEAGGGEDVSALPSDPENRQTLDALSVETVNSAGNMSREEEGGKPSASIASADAFAPDGDVPPESAQSSSDAASNADPSLAELEEELFPLSDENDVLARGGFLPETSPDRQKG